MIRNTKDATITNLDLILNILVIKNSLPSTCHGISIFIRFNHSGFDNELGFTDFVRVLLLGYISLAIVLQLSAFLAFLYVDE